MSELQQTQTVRSKKTFYLLIMVFILPFTLAATLHLLNLKPSGKSYGNLIQPPKSLQIPMLTNAQHKPFKPEQWRKIWSVVMLVEGVCGKACQAQIHILKQVQTSLNKDSKRVQRILLVPVDKLQAYDDLQKQYPDLIILEADTAAASFTSQFHAANAGLYLVDPFGNLMMHYPQQFEAKGLRADLMRLLKNSWAG